MFANGRTYYVVPVPRTRGARAYCGSSGICERGDCPSAFTIDHRGRRARNRHGTGRSRGRRAGRASFTRTQPRPGARRSLPHLAPRLPCTQGLREVKHLPEAGSERDVPGIRRPTIPSSVSDAIGPATVDAKKCTGCGRCVAVCPVGAIMLEDEIAVVNESVCTACGLCLEACPREAIALRS